MKIINLNEHRFIDNRKPLIGEWLGEDFPDLANRAFIICENQNTRSENDQLLEFHFRNLVSMGLSDNDMIVIDRSSELGYFDKSRAEMLVRLCNEAGCNLNRIVYASQNKLIKDQILKEFKGGDRPNYLFFHHFAVGIASIYSHAKLGDFDYDNNNGRIPFICLNNKLRPHRVALMSMMIESGLQSEMILTNAEISSLYDYDNIKERVIQEYPVISEAAIENIKSNQQNMQPLGSELLYGWPHEVSKSIISIVTESETSSFCHRVTEKSLKPIAYHRPFIVFGSKKSLNIIKSWGFSTFNSIYDEGYDEFESPQERLIAIRDLVISLIPRIEEVSQNCKEICSKNQTHLVTNFLNVLRAQFRGGVHNLDL
ncbi:MAG: hypothetical protein JJU18_03745 [Oceanicaulis sp.]|nr:hypothetical protein [Oceanicaulis sp.]